MGNHETPPQLSTSGSHDELVIIGSLFADRYDVEAKIGQGGMGQVFLVRDRLLDGTQVALKAVYPHLSRFDKARQRFLREVQLTRQVAHPAVVRTFDVGVYEELLYFTMEFVEGQSLEEYLALRTVSLPIGVAIFASVLEGLEAIHTAGIVHRDLKPGNILLARNGVVKIADFGIARTEDSHMTDAQEVVGSSAYMAPELWKAEDVTPAVDLYALGAIVFEIIAGRRVFEGETHEKLLYQHLNERPRALRAVVPAAPVWLEALVDRLLSKDPAARFNSAAQVRDMLDSVWDGPHPDLSDLWIEQAQSLSPAAPEAGPFEIPRRPSREDARTALLPQAFETLGRTWLSDEERINAVRFLAVLPIEEAVDRLIEAYDKLTSNPRASATPTTPIGGPLVGALGEALRGSTFEKAQRFLRDVLASPTASLIARDGAAYALKGDTDPATFESLGVALSSLTPELQATALRAFTESFDRLPPEKRKLAEPCLDIVARRLLEDQPKKNSFRKELRSPSLFLLRRHCTEQTEKSALKVLLQSDSYEECYSALQILESRRTKEVDQGLVAALQDPFRPHELYDGIAEALLLRKSAETKAVIEEILAEEQPLTQVTRSVQEFIVWGAQKRHAHNLRRKARLNAAKKLLKGS